MSRFIEFDALQLFIHTYVNDRWTHVDISCLACNYSYTVTVIDFIMVMGFEGCIGCKHAYPTDFVKELLSIYKLAGLEGVKEYLER